MKQVIEEVKYHLGIQKWGYLVFVVFVLWLGFSFLVDSPSSFKEEVIVEIPEGVSVKEASNILKENKVIRSRTIFNVVLQMSGGKVVAGEYLFSKTESVFSVADRLSNGKYGIPIKTVTLSEGMTVMEMAERLEYNFPNFNTDNFINLALKYEGYLFPDTYRFSANVSEVDVIETLRETFDIKVSEIRSEIEASGKTLDEIVTMASIVEKEATRDTIQEVTDVLWHRIDIGMALQVDATFVYSIGKNSFTVTKTEIRDEDNEYNTYTHKGLPPTPISNPGLDAIKASISPNPTEYLFFLTGRDGQMYFAVDFDGHRLNRARYLD